jgi:hypothetical protein
VTDQISLMGLDHVFVCTAVEGKIYFRHYSINLKKSGTNVPSHPCSAQLFSVGCVLTRRP